MTIGPVDVVVLHFPGSAFNGDIAPALTALVANGTVRVIDLLIIGKAIDGTLFSVELAGLDEDLQAAFAEVNVAYSGSILGDDDVTSATESLEPGSSAALIVVENTWAIPLVKAIEGSGGQLVDQIRLSGDDVLAALEGYGG
jgi:hypothetical protein